MTKQKASPQDLLESLRAHPPDAGVNCEESLLRILREGFETVPFNQFLGLKVVSLTRDEWRISFDRRDEFIGNPVKGILHGGVISAVFDATGGLIAAVCVIQDMKGRALEEIIERSVKVHTIDLRVDYLKPGKGPSFQVSGSLLRMGSAVCVIRMDLRDDREQQIAAAIGTYKVG